MKNTKYFFYIFILFLNSTIAISQNTVVDRDGNIYNTIKIGNRLWMAENLRTENYANGNIITSFCYDNDTAYCNIYGKLYPWYSINQIDSAGVMQNICMDNWHVPTDSEWSNLINFLGGDKIAGTALRKGTYSSFDLKYGGNYHPELQVFSFINKNVYFWSSTQYNKSVAWIRMIGANTKNINRSTVAKEYSFSIRCVKNELINK